MTYDTAASIGVNCKASLKSWGHVEKVELKEVA